MKIAVTYDEQTGEVFQHFGHSDAFKIYEFDESGLTGAMVLNTSAINGHEAMASFLAKGDVKVLICGGVGEGAMLALSEEGILVVPGVSGDADLAVAQFLQGVLALSACEVPVLIAVACTVFSQRAVASGLVAALIATYTLVWFLLSMGFAFEFPVAAPRRAKTQTATPLAGGAAAVRAFVGATEESSDTSSTTKEV